MPVLEQDRFLTVQETAELLSVHPDTVRALVHRGDITGVKVGRQFRIAPDLLRRYLYAGRESSVELLLRGGV
jgi:excisionase family DNA binding protein